MLDGGRVGVKPNMQSNRKCVDGNDNSILRLTTNIIKYKADNNVPRMNKNFKRVNSTKTECPQTSNEPTYPEDVDVQQGNLSLYRHHTGLVNTVQNFI